MYACIQSVRDKRKWRKRSASIVKFYMHFLLYFHSRYKGTLTIDNVKKEDAGVYTCTARNNAGHVTMKSTLKVVTKPVVEGFQNITYVNITLYCICIETVKLLNITWFLNA